MLIVGGFTLSGGDGFVIQTSPPPLVTTDLSFKYVTLLISGEGINGQTNNVYLDSSGYNWSWQAVQNPTYSSQSSYSPNSKASGEWSVFFPGSVFATPYANIAYNANLLLNGQDCTVECWAYLDEAPQSGANASAPRAQVIACQGVGSYTNSPSDHNWMLFADNSSIYFGKHPNFVTANSSLLPVNQWTHIAATMSSTGVGEIYIDGVQVASQSGRTTLGNSVSYVTRIGYGLLGSGAGSDSIYEGYISNFRIAKSRVYTANFTPSATPLTAITNTQLLTCQDNRFKDNSPNNITIDASATIMVTPSSPFTSAVSYNTAIHGGSISLSSSNLVLAANSVFALGTGDFTIEGWYNFRSLSGSTTNGIWTALASGKGHYLRTGTFATAGILTFYGTDFSSSSISASAPVRAGRWYHLAVSRVNSVTRFFIDGIVQGSFVDYNNYPTSQLILGSSTSIEADYNMSDFRIIKGTGLYTANFSLPSAPLTAVNNTVILLNGTNAGVYDSTKNTRALATFGNVALSTTQKKFGNTSIYFDGTGDYVRRTFGGDLTQRTLKLGKGGFTIELWAYFERVTGVQYLYDGRGGSEGARPAIYANSTSLIYRVSSADRITASSVLTANTWHHIAVSRSGTSTKMFLNGSQVGSTYTDTTNYLADTFSYVNPTIGASSVGAAGSSAFQGYMDDIRVTKSVARYTDNFTPPTETFPGA